MFPLAETILYDVLTTLSAIFWKRDLDKFLICVIKTTMTQKPPPTTNKILYASGVITLLAAGLFIAALISAAAFVHDGDYPLWVKLTAYSMVAYILSRLLFRLSIILNINQQERN